MTGAAETIVRERVLAHVAKQKCVQPLHLEVVGEIDSTNRHLLERAMQGAPSGTVCLARIQTAGRGRRGKSWVGPCGNIYLSLLWKPHNSLESLSGVSLAIGVAVAQLALDYGVDGIALKWPNDVMHRGAKMCGILVETAATQDDEVVAVIGVGLNVSMAQEFGRSINQRWTDLSTAAGSTLCYEEVAGRLIARLLEAVNAFECDGLGTLQSNWNRFDTLMGHQVVASGARGEIRGRAKGIDAAGALLIDVNGVEHRVVSGEVSLRPVPCC